MISWIRRNIPWEVALQFFIWSLAAMILGLFDLYDFRFDPRRFFNINYIIEVGTLWSLGVLIFAVRLMLKTKELIQDDSENKTLESKMNSYVNGEHKLKYIVEFIYKVINKERRRNAFKEKMEIKIGGLLDRFNDKDTYEYTMYHSEKDLEKRIVPIRRRVKKLIRYQDKVTEKYLEDNKDFLKVRFVKLTPNFMTSGFNQGSHSSNVNPSKKFTTALKDNAANFAIPSIFTAFILGSILLPTEADPWAILLVLAIKLVLLFFQDWSAVRYAPTYKGKTWVHDLHLRKVLWERYFTWILKEKNEKNGGSS